MAGNHPPIKIMRTGAFTATDGTRVTFAASDLAGMVAAYNAGPRLAPIVLGHPKVATPTFGRIDRLSLTDGFVEATPADVKPGLIQMVKEGRYKRVSASFLPPLHSRNPKPGNYYLEHVGMLGAAAPGVRGLGVVAFAGGPRTSMTFEDDLRIGEVSAPPGTIPVRARAAEIQSRAVQPMSSSEAMSFAETERSILSFASTVEDPAQRMRLAIVGRIVAIQTADPRLAYHEARQQAEREAALARVRGETLSFAEAVLGPATRT